MKTVVRKTVRLHPVQHAFRHSHALYRAFVGGRGSGKTFAGSYDLIRRARRGGVYAVVAPTYTILRDSSMRAFLGLARSLGVLDPAALRTSAPPELTLSTGAEVLFRSGDDPERLRGPSLAGAWLDEASLMDRAVFDVMIAALRDEGRQGWLSATFTPKGLDHWTTELWGRPDPPPDTAVFRARTRDNPFLPPDFAETVRRQYDDLTALRELEGEFVDVEGSEWPAEYFRPELTFDHWPAGGFVATVVALDPSRGRESKAGDYSAYVVARLDAAGTVWLDAHLTRESLEAAVARGVALAREYHPIDSLVCETNIGLELLVAEFARQQRAAGAMFPVDVIENHQPKALRIRRLGPYLARGQLRFRNTPGGRLLVTQLRQFPRGKFDDSCDALEMSIRVLERLVNGGGR